MNLLILLVLCSGDPGDSRSPTSLYLTHLALVDLLFVLSYLYDAIALYGVTGTWYNSLTDSTRTSLCYWKEITRPLNSSVSIYMLTLLSIDRYIAIVMSTKRTKFYNWARKFRKSVVRLNAVSLNDLEIDIKYFKVCLLVWIAGIFISVPLIRNIDFDPDFNACGVKWKGNEIKQRPLCHIELLPKVLR